MGDGHASGPKLPVGQLTILAVARFAEPLAQTSVFPYLPDMIRSFGVPQTSIARWVGLTSSVFALAQSVSAVPWGRASDYYGRKPILICGLLCTMVCFVIWGFSTSLAMAVAVRATLGAVNGNVGIIRTVVAELVPEKELQPRAFSIMPLVWSLGSVVGPSFGGFFAEPARQFPGVFGHIELFKKYPYALPNLIATVFFLISVTSTLLFLKETLPTRAEDRDWGLLVGKRLKRTFRKSPQLHRRRSSFVDGEATAPLVPSKLRAVDRTLPVRTTYGMRDVFTPQTVINLVVYCILAFHSIAFDQNIIVFLSLPVQEQTPENTKLPFYFSGGFGLEPGEIGTIFTLYGVVCAVIQFVAYPPLVSHFGVLRCLQICVITFPLVYIVTPYTSLFATETGRFAAIIIVMIFKAFCVIVAFPSTTILLTNSATSLTILGTLNGFTTSFSGLGRGFGPLITGLVFDWGSGKGYMVTSFFFLALVAVLATIPAFMIVEGDGPTASADSTDGEDSDIMEDSGVILPNESAIGDSDLDGDNESDYDGDTDVGGSEQSPLLGSREDQNGNYGATSSETR